MLAIRRGMRRGPTNARRDKRTFGQVILNFQVGFLRGHGHVQRGHGNPFGLAGGPRAIVGRHCVLSGYGLERGGRGSRGS